MSTSDTLVVGSGIAGLACARALHDAGVAVRVVDRGRVVGGRLASKRLDDRPVDIGARYFTVPDGSGFASVVDDWITRGLVRPWTDTFWVYATDGSHEPKSGPMRYAAPAGLRSLATDLADRLQADGVPLDQEVDVAGIPEGGDVLGSRYDTVVLAMPDPQAKRMLLPGSIAAASLADAGDWQPTITVVARWRERLWPADLHGAFVDGSEVLAFVADDGDRRGDGAPVLVAHTTAPFARAHLEHPESAVAPVVEAVGALLGLSEAPVSTSAHRWTFSSPATQHPDLFLLSGGDGAAPGRTDRAGGVRVGVCGDAWGARSAVSTAWESGTALGQALAQP
ncbi:NAD(P)/FAD-dependent oxidoreductase [Subtercola boreus]|uniref:Amine oxidase domain-containing protein n=1 Tax=Subtercola boreus TaxID=120213 RepID=A0A3E0W8D2_9MICO|nr:FAD-dependent oxidoreductase [Subtercola boreus]RFA18052.1 hypothetical protein B7R24_15480 [Subtercola boreus]RFA18434.1 hypothetical protein B7R23_15515 [Subtercola boreus]RFA24963.1 hypothetical protein B7R25_15510 [Subtercola boreus]